MDKVKVLVLVILTIQQQHLETWIEQSMPSYNWSASFPCKIKQFDVWWILLTIHYWLLIRTFMLKRSTYTSVCMVTLQFIIGRLWKWNKTQLIAAIPCIFWGIIVLLFLRKILCNLCTSPRWLVVILGEDIDTNLHFCFMRVFAI